MKVASRIVLGALAFATKLPALPASLEDKRDTGVPGPPHNPIAPLLRVREAGAAWSRVQHLPSHLLHAPFPAATWPLF